jgi:hypothetical protein
VLGAGVEHMGRHPIPNVLHPTTTCRGRRLSATGMTSSTRDSAPN